MRYLRIAAHLAVYSEGRLTLEEAEEAIYRDRRGERYYCSWYMMEVLTRVNKRVARLDPPVRNYALMTASLVKGRDWLEVNREMIHMSIRMAHRIMCRHNDAYWEMLQKARRIK